MKTTLLSAFAAVLILAACQQHEVVSTFVTPETSEYLEIEYFEVFEDREIDHTHYGVFKEGGDVYNLNEDQSELLRKTFKSGSILGVYTHDIQQFLRSEISLDEIFFIGSINRSPGSGPKNQLVVIVDMPFYQVSCSDEQIESFCFNPDVSTKSLSTYYDYHSDGQVSFFGEVVRINIESNLYQFGAIMSASNAQLAYLGYNIHDYDYVTYFTPDVSNYAGAAFLGGKFAQIDVCSSKSVLIHEIGHNLGMSHAGKQFPGDSHSSYGDCSSPLGCSFTEMNGAHRYQMNWISTSETEFITDVNNEIKIEALEKVATNGAKYLALLKDYNINYTLFISKRAPSFISVDLDNEFVHSLSIHKVHTNSSVTTLVGLIGEGEHYYDPTFDKKITHDGFTINGEIIVRVK